MHSRRETKIVEIATARSRCMCDPTSIQEESPRDDEATPVLMINCETSIAHGVVAVEPRGMCQGGAFSVGVDD